MLDAEFIKQWLLAKLRSKDIIIWLVAINVIVYIAILFFNLFGLPFGVEKIATNFCAQWLALPSHFNLFLSKFYTLLTYQFVHSKLLHLLSNMLLLFYFGNLYISLTHKKKLLPLYIYGGLFAGLVFLLVYNFNPVLTALPSVSLVGASGSVMALVGAVATLVPQREIALFGRFNIKFQWIAFFFAAINLLGIGGENAASSYAHLGGLLFGFLFVLLARNGVDIVKPFNRVFDSILSFLDFSKKPKITYVNETFKDKKNYTSSTKKNNPEDEEKLNAILDKIREHGYDRLTKAEKAFLFNYSNK